MGVPRCLVNLRHNYRDVMKEYRTLCVTSEPGELATYRAIRAVLATLRAKLVAGAFRMAEGAPNRQVTSKARSTLVIVAIITASDYWMNSRGCCTSVGTSASDSKSLFSFAAFFS